MSTVLLLAKLNTYVHFEGAIAYIKNYFCIDTNNSTQAISDIFLFNIFIIDMLYFTESCHLCSYADDNALYMYMIVLSTTRPMIL